MELVRLLLLQQEGNEDAKAAIERIQSQGEDGGYFVAHHAALLIDAGFIVGSVLNDRGGVPVGAAMIRLTWEGHNFLDTIREETVWKKTTEKVLKPGASWTIGVLLEVAKAEIRSHLGLL